jgi:hypothetical protein
MLFMNALSPPCWVCCDPLDAADPGRGPVPASAAGGAPRITTKDVADEDADEGCDAACSVDGAGESERDDDPVEDSESDEAPAVSLVPSSSTTPFVSGETGAAASRPGTGVGASRWKSNCGPPLWLSFVGRAVQPTTSLPHDDRISLACPSPCTLSNPGIGAGTLGAVEDAVVLDVLLLANISAIGSGIAGTGGMVSALSLCPPSPLPLRSSDLRVALMRKKDRDLLTLCCCCCCCWWLMGRR